MTFRFILQPLMAVIAALRDGVSDARLGRSPYFWSIVRGVESRSARLREGIISTARIMILGVIMDTIYQWRVLHAFYPGQAAAAFARTSVSLVRFANNLSLIHI